MSLLCLETSTGYNSDDDASTLSYSLASLQDSDTSLYNKSTRVGADIAYLSQECRLVSSDPFRRPRLVPGTVSEGLNGWSEALTVGFSGLNR